MPIPEDIRLDRIAASEQHLVQKLGPLASCQPVIMDGSGADEQAPPPDHPAMPVIRDFFVPICPFSRPA